MLPFARFRVEDDSMKPYLEAGDYVLVNRWAYRFRPPKAGDVVVFSDPHMDGRYLVKRIARPSSPNRYDVAGDNAAQSRDSRKFGPIERERILGKVWLRFKP